MKFDLDTTLDNWEKCIDEMSQVGGLRITATSDQDPSVNTSTIQINRHFGLRSISVSEKNGEIKNSKLLFNPDYVAYITEISGGWHLESVVTSTDLEYENLVSTIKYWAWNSLFTFAPIQELRQCNEKVVRRVGDQNVNGEQFEITFRNVNDRLKQLTVTVARDTGFFPSIVTFDYGNAVRKKEFLDWAQFEGYSLWQTEVASIPNGPGIGSMLRYDREFDAVTRIAPTEECRLSFYGLPEPDFVSIGHSKKWLLIVFTTLALVGIGTYLWKRN